MCVFRSHTLVRISWMCKKQTSVSHSSTESEIISLDAGLRLESLETQLRTMIERGGPLFALTRFTNAISKSDQRFG